jgi:virginiamycin A acetyltransferase
MIIDNIHIEPYQIDKNETIFCDFHNERPGFPLLVLDYNSYITSAQVQSEINFDPNRIKHNLQIGKFCSVADNVKFMLGLNHDYKSVTTGVCSFLKDLAIPSRIVQKNQIIIQNDVWIGSGATIMSGVTVHNGAVVASDAHVVKDVPPYAIVGSNPAQIIKYRFNPEQIDKLLKISWWNWSIGELNSNKNYFTKSIDEFIGRFYKENVNTNLPVVDTTKINNTCLFFSDLHSNYPITEYVIRNFCATCGSNKDMVLLIYMNNDSNTSKYVNQIRSVLQELKYENEDNIELLIENLIDEQPLFKMANYYITNRDEKNVLRTCYADMFNVKTISGVDDPVFPASIF